MCFLSIDTKSFHPAYDLPYSKSLDPFSGQLNPFTYHSGITEMRRGHLLRTIPHQLLDIASIAEVKILMKMGLLTESN